jgi:hypothetical protein
MTTKTKMNIQVRKATVNNIDEWRVYLDGEIVARCEKEQWAERVAEWIKALPIGYLEKDSDEKDFNFTFETEADYEKAKSSGYITTFDVVRIKIKNLMEGNTFDYPVYSREQYSKELYKLLVLPQIQVLDIYQDKLYYDILEQD